VKNMRRSFTINLGVTVPKTVHISQKQETIILSLDANEILSSELVQIPQVLFKEGRRSSLLYQKAARAVIKD
jgi:hypothetical protein